MVINMTLLLLLLMLQVILKDSVGITSFGTVRPPPYPHLTCSHSPPPSPPHSPFAD